MMAEEGVEITEAYDESDLEVTEIDEDDGTVDLGEEF